MHVYIAGLLLFLAQAASPLDSMDRYYVAFLRPDPARKQISNEERQRIQAAHMANIQSMAKRGVLVAAGPFEDQKPDIVGLFLFRVGSIEEARRIAAEDPTVTEHRNTIDVHAWQGPKGIGDEYFRLHKEKPETPEGMGVQPLLLLHWADRSKLNPQLQTAHREYMLKLQREGKVAAAGPMPGEEDPVGLGIFRRIPLEEARSLMEADPTVKAGVVRLEWHRWWCAEHVLP